MPAYRLPSPHDRPPLSRRASGLALALGVNLVLIIVLLGLGVIAPPGQRTARGIVVELIPDSRSSAPAPRTRAERPKSEPAKAEPEPTRIALPSKPTIALRPKPADEAPPWIEMSKDQLAAADISKLAPPASGSAGDSEAVGRGPNGEVLYAAEWARHPSNAELGGYLPKDAPDGYGLIACRTIPDNRVDDCVELDQSPRGSHLASAVRQAAWQFRVRPPRKNGRAMIGEWVSIRIDYIRTGGD